jgi:signal transduction histidine kinase
VFNKAWSTLIVFLCSAAAIATARSHVNPIDPNSFFHDIYASNPFTGMLSSANELKADSLFELLDKGNFEAMERMTFNSARNTLYRYISFRIRNTSNRNGTLIWLMKNAAANRVVLFRRDASGITQLCETGDHFNFNTRPLPFFLFAFPLELKSQEQADFIMLVDKRHENLFVPFNFYSLNAFDVYKSRLYLIFGGIAGAFIFMLMLNFFLGIAFRDRIHVIYFFYILGNLFVILSYEGLDFAYIYPNFPLFSDCSRYISTAFQLAVSLLLFRQFSGTPLLDASSRFQKIGLALLLLHIVFIPLSYIVFLHNNWLPVSRISYLQFFSLSNFFMMSFIIMDGIRKFRSGFKPALFFVVAVAIMYIGGLEYSLNINGILGTHLLFKSLIPNTITIGMLVELLFVTAGIVYLYNSLKKQRDRFETAASQTRLALELASQTYRKQERERLANDIHDEIASRIFGLRMLAEGIRNSARQNTEVSNNLLQLREQLDEIGLHARSVINDLHSEGKIHSSQLATEILRILESFSRSSPIALVIHSISFENGFEINSKDSGEVLRIIQELCNNSLKHSKAQQLHFEAGMQSNNFFIQFSEQPLSVNPLPFKAGKGLQSINQRVADLKGKFEIRFEDSRLVSEMSIPIALD